MTSTKPIQETVLIVSTMVRNQGQLDSPWHFPDHPTIENIEYALQTHADPRTIIFGGGEPTLRSDFPKLIPLLPENGILATDGLALHKESIGKMLAELGLQRVRIYLHSARADAHNWLVGIPGAHRRVCGAIKTLIASGISVSVETVLTRPTSPYLEETTAFLHRLGVREVSFRMLERRGAATDVFVTLAPRFGLMEPSLEAALQVALRHDMRVSLCGLPHCAAPHFGEFHRPDPIFIVPADVPHLPTRKEPHGGCDPCPSHCRGAPLDYTSLFGWTEFGAERGPMPPDNHAVSKPQSGPDVPWPPPRANRTPATRVQDAITQSLRYDLDGDPVIGSALAAPPDIITVRLPEGESTRNIKKRLVRASQQGARTLHIVGDTNHPEAFSLLREAQRLSFEQLVYSGDLVGLADIRTNKLFHLRGFHGLCVPIDGNSLETARKISDVASVPICVFKTVTPSIDLQELPHMWHRQEWPGNPTFAIAPEVDRASLSDTVDKMEPSPEKDALLMALSLSPQPLFGHPGSPGVVTPTGFAWPNLPSFEVQ